MKKHAQIEKQAIARSLASIHTTGSSGFMKREERKADEQFLFFDRVPGSCYLDRVNWR